MTNFTLPRITEKKYLAITATTLLADGGTDGTITVINTYCFKAGQCVLFKQGGNALIAKIKRVISDTQFIVIDKEDAVITTNKLDMSTFTAGSTVELMEVKRPVIDLLEIQRAVYEEEPTVALRTHFVDWLGRSYDITNPVPVRLSDGSVNIGTVNAELEVQLSHQDNTPDVGDIADSVQVGDGEDILAINSDGSINVKANTVSTPNIVHIAVPIANTEQSYTFSSGTKRFKFRIQEGNAKSSIAYTVGTSGSQGWTVRYGSVYEETDLDFSSGVTLYFQVNKAGQTAEILYWE